jgi:hypothetical protein
VIFAAFGMVASSKDRFWCDRLSSIDAVIKRLTTPMKTTLTLQDLALIVSVQRQDPTILSPEFLSESGIVPAEWVVAPRATHTPQSSQVRYQNGIKIAATPNQSIFAQSLTGTTGVEIPGITQRYLEVLRNNIYRGVDINLRAYVSFEGNKKTAVRDHIFSHLLAQGPWQDFGVAPVQASLNLTYTLEKGQLNLSINEVNLQLPEQQPFPVMLLIGNFTYPLTSVPESEKLQALSEIISNWQQAVETFKTLVTERFLGTVVPTELPSLFATAQ